MTAPSPDAGGAPARAVEFENYSLGTPFLTLLSGVTFTLHAGDSTAIIGPAGSGKSMLLHVIGQTLWEAASGNETFVQSGTCRILGNSVAPEPPDRPTRQKIRPHIAIVNENSAWLPMSIAENFAFVLTLAGTPAPPFQEIVESLPLSQKQKARISSLAELSPSQVEPPLLQHLAIIRSLLRTPRILLLDEPFGRMDPVLLRQTENLILTQSGQTAVVWATNDLFQASRVTDLTLFLFHGRVMEATPTLQFFTNPQTREAEHFIAGREEE